MSSLYVILGNFCFTGCARKKVQTFDKSYHLPGESEKTWGVWEIFHEAKSLP